MVDTDSSSSFENIGMHILMPKDSHLRQNYVFRILEKKRSNHLGYYEKLLLEKFLSPPLPVICIVGDMGSGKTTTIDYLLHYYLSKRAFIPIEHPKETDQTKKELINKILLGHVDFLSSNIDDSKIKAINIIIAEMRARISAIMNNDEEFVLFWDTLKKQFNYEDMSVAKVVRKLVAQLANRPAGIEERIKVYKELAEDYDWHLNYLILLWRYILDSNSSINKKIQLECKCNINSGLIILDNMDSLPPKIQGQIYNNVLRNAHQRGPAFVLVVRPETFARLGRADLVFDIVSHEGPSPIDVIKYRLGKYVEKPQFYLSKTRLSDTDKVIIDTFLKRLVGNLHKEYQPLEKFLEKASGNSIRLGLILAQGIFLLTPTQLHRQELTPFFVIRACINQGKPQYSWYVKSPVENVFRVVGCEGNLFTLLLKIRIMQYLLRIPETEVGFSIQIEQWKGSLLSELRNALTLFDYEENEIRQAINQMIRKECQILTSNGENDYNEKWGDNSETIFLSKVGEAYITYLVYSVDYLQEIMFDSFSYPGIAIKLGYVDQQQSEQLSEKFERLYRFLEIVHEIDCEQTRQMLKKINQKLYIEKFGGYLISSLIIIRAAKSAIKILNTAKERYPRSVFYYDNAISLYESLSILAKNRSEEILGVEFHFSDPE